MFFLILIVFYIFTSENTHNIMIRFMGARYLFLFLALPMFSCSHQEKIIELSITNPSGFDRKKEIVEVNAGVVQSLEADEFIIIDSDGNQIPYQVTYDGKLIFPVTVASKSSSVFRLQAGTPDPFKPLVYGRQFPERVDDIAWENDRIAFRTYGPALQATGEQAFGYDVWVKRVPHLVLENRYGTELNPGTRARIDELRKTDPEAARELANSVSYHIDHGDGLDYYNVGPTLGAGTSAIWYNDGIIYPYCYADYTILDEGPLRFTVRLTYHPLTVGSNTNVIETRVISLNAHSQLNKITVTYSNLEEPVVVATGIVIHAPSEEYQIDKKAGYIAYAEAVEKENGQTYVGAVFPGPIEEARAVYFTEEESKQRRAEGHVMAFTRYEPGTEYVYYAGAGWNKWGFASSFSWFKYIKGFAGKIKEPLIVEINPEP